MGKKPGMLQFEIYNTKPNVLAALTAFAPTAGCATEAAGFAARIRTLTVYTTIFWVTRAKDKRGRHTHPTR